MPNNKNHRGVSRKPIGEDSRMVCFYLPLRVYDLLNAEAHTRNVTVSSLLRESLIKGTKHVLNP